MLEYIYMDTNVAVTKKTVLDALRKKHHLRLMLLHGSQVGGSLHSESDIDVGVVRESGKPAFRSVDLTSDLMETFESDRVDLVDLTHADPLLLFAATKTCHLLSGNEADLKELQRVAFHRLGK